MDASEYLPMFLAESREHLQELNLAVVRIEEDPTDTVTVDEIFRIAHSFKGMSATMGFAGIAALTHELENVFELLRERRGGLERETIDVVLECLDALGAAVESIDSDGTEKIDPQPLVARLEGLVRETDPPAAPPADEPGGPRRVDLTVRLRDDVAMPAVRAYMVLAALSDHGEVLSSTPVEEAVDTFEGRTIEASIATYHEHGQLRRAIAEIADVAEVEIDGAGTEPPAREAGPTAAPRKKPSSSVRVDAERLDQLMHFMGELVVHRTALESLVARADSRDLSQAMQDLTRSSQALQQMVMQVRMIEVEAVFMRLPRLVRDLSTKLGKQVELKLSGGDTELDRTVVDAIGDPMVHLVRNSLDHGLEPPDAREAAGKPAGGTLEISARHAGGNVVISVRDDGRGIDPAAVARRAAERGLIPADAVDAVDMPKAVELLFAPGFSTAEVTSDISGRGVGMDAVRNAVRGLGGEVMLRSETGHGTTAEIRLPLTLAIMSALLVEAGGLSFAVPLDRVERTLRLDDHAVRSVAGRPMLLLRDSVIPLRDASAALGHGTCSGSHAVVVHAGDDRLALAVDRLIGQRELVTRPLPAEVGGRAAVSGGAVLSNGQIALIVDSDALVAAATDLARTTPQAA